MDKNPPANPRPTRGRGFDPWSGKLPHAVEQLSTFATASAAQRPEPAAHSTRGRHGIGGGPTHCNQTAPAQQQGPRMAKVNKIITELKKPTGKMTW